MAFPPSLICSAPLAPDGSMLPGLFGEEYAFDPAGGILYSQGCRRSAAGGSRLECELATDVVAWDVHKAKQVGSLQLLNQTLLAMHWDPSPTAAPHSLGALVPNGQHDDPVLGTLNKLSLVGINPENGEFVETTVYNRNAMMPGYQFSGPAIIEESESTLILGSGAKARVDSQLNLIVDLTEEG